MTVMWILIITTFQGGLYQPEHMQQFVIPHKYESEQNCKEAGGTIMRTDIKQDFRVFDYAPENAEGPKYPGRARMNTDCVPILVD